MAAPSCYIWRLKERKPAPNPDDIELYPDAMERLERAIKIAARHPPIKHPTTGRKTVKPKKLPPADAAAAAGRNGGSSARLRLTHQMTAQGVRRDKAALSSGCKPHPATAPAESNRSRR
jgi:hypothetical protein